VDSFSVLIGGKAGDGITQAGSMIAHLLNELGYRLYTYVDSPSLIRGGHNYVIVRAHRGRITAHRDHVNVMIALTPDTLERHQWRLKQRPVTVFDNQMIAPTSLPSMAHPFRTGIPVKTILEQEGAPSVMRNSAILGAFCKAISIPWETLEDVIRRYQPKQTELNLRVARLGFELATEKLLIDLPGGGPWPVMTGLEATGLGLLRGGLEAYTAYPTPASPTSATSSRTTASRRSRSPAARAPSSRSTATPTTSSASPPRTRSSPCACRTSGTPRASPWLRSWTRCSRCTCTATRTPARHW
jgi:2-oxoglutarate ferredoxin oxidoreductase subunit alpha